MISSDGVRETLGALWSPLVAVTTADGARRNGLIAATAVFASLLAEAPRVLVELSPATLTHRLIEQSGVLALHLLPIEPEDSLRASLDIVHLLGMRSGTELDKLAGLTTRVGTTGSPILMDALSFVEARVVKSLAMGDLTVFVGDVVAGEKLRRGSPLTVGVFRDRMPAEWGAEWERSRAAQLEAARRGRGLAR